MKLRTAKALFVAIAVAAASMSACDSNVAPSPNQPTPTAAPGTPDESTGTVGLNLQVGSGVSISTVNWTIHNSTLLAMDLTGSVDVSQSPAIQFVVGGLPAGAGYTITLTATTDGSSPLNCLGSGMFSIVANATSQVNVTLVCSSGAAVDAGNNGSVSVVVTPQIPPMCAAVTSLSASPSSVDVGGSVSLAAEGMDNGGGSLGFSWAITGGTGTGTFSSATSPSTTFTCTGTGGVTVTVTATDSGGTGCTNNTGSIMLTCGGASGADAGAAVEASAPDTAATEEAAAPETGSVDAGPPDTGAPDTGAPDTGAADAGAPDTGAVEDTGAPDTGVADTAAPDTSAMDTGAPDTGLADTGVADASDGGTAVTTQSIIDKQGSMCLSCVQTNGCFDPTLMGGTCELLPSTILTHLAGPIGDGGPTCATVLGTEPVSEQQICLQTLQGIFSSGCGASLQLTPCLCGTTDPTQCAAGSVTPNGPLYDEYACDFDSTSGSTINTDFILQNFGAGMANSIAQCAGAFGCACF